MKLTNNFSLEELTVSQTALRNNIDNTPSSGHIENLKLLCENILQPLKRRL
jgi:zinc D-Ala-D-Ala carboxypeptidase